MFDPISLALNPPRFVKSRKAPIKMRSRNPSPVWPLPALNGREPSVLPQIGSKPRGIELAYARLGPCEVAKCAPNTPNGTDTHFMPNMTPVFAVDDGEITYAGQLSHGYAVVIDHLDGRATYYSHLEQLGAIRTDIYRTRAQFVRGGDQIGVVGSVSPGGFKQLHFELWKRRPDCIYDAIDPTDEMTKWRVLPWHDHLTPLEPAAANEAA